MDLSKLIDPSSLVGAYFISISASLIVGFLTGKNYEKKKITKSIQKGNGNINIQNSNMKRR